MNENFDKSHELECDITEKLRELKISYPDPGNEIPQFLKIEIFNKWKSQQNKNSKIVLDLRELLGGDDFIS